VSYCGRHGTRSSCNTSRKAITDSMAARISTTKTVPLVASTIAGNLPKAVICRFDARSECGQRRNRSGSLPRWPRSAAPHLASKNSRSIFTGICHCTTVPGSCRCCCRTGSAVLGPLFSDVRRHASGKRRHNNGVHAEEIYLIVVSSLKRERLASAEPHRHGGKYSPAPA
jgi:hypothetical protein